MRIKLVIDARDLEGAYLPHWYGIAYEEFIQRRIVLYIIPLNLFVRYARKFYYLLYEWFKFSDYRDKLGEAYLNGYNKGRREGQEISGWRLKQMIKEELDKTRVRL